MLHTLHNKFQRVRDLITEYDKADDRCRNPSPAFHDFVQKLKDILNIETKITRKHGASFSKSNRNKNVSGSSSSSSSQINVGDPIINQHPKVIEALKNHVVLTEILKFGSYCDLNNFRLVNKQWKRIANSAIIQKKLWELSIFDTFGGYNNKNRQKALSELNDCIESSGGSFPLTAIDFSDVSDNIFLESPGLLRFYALIGQSIKGLKFSNFGPLSMNDFQDLLMNKMPNVDHISAGNVDFWADEEECHVPIVLPNLKTIEFISLNDQDGDDELEVTSFEVLPYYKNLLLGATNLKEILDFQIEHTDAALDTDKMDCIKKFKFDLDLEACSGLYTKFSYLEPKLTSLAITRHSFNPGNNGEDLVFYSPELAQSLKRILISSKDTLKHLKCMPHIFPADFQLPKFPNLKFLTVFDVADELDDELPIPHVFPSAGCVCSEMFPNLHTVSLDIRLTEHETSSRYFARQVFPSVKNLELFEGSLELGGAFKTNFPNVSHIKVSNYEKATSHTVKYINVFSPVFYPQIPQVPKFHTQIESLELNQCLLACSGRQFQFDALVTGVPPQICKKLLARHNRYKVRGGESIMAVKETLELVQTPNYLFRHSKGFRRLKINFNHKDNANFQIPKPKNSDSNLDLDIDFDLDFGSDFECEPGSNNEDIELWKAVISPVSFVYGFSLMPNLEQVIIGYDHCLPNAPDIAQVLNPLAQFPYVMIVHEPSVEDG